MSLMKTLSKVALGIAAAKVAKGVMERGKTGQNQAGFQPGSGSLFGGAHSRQASNSGGGLEGMLGGLLGGSGAGGASAGGLGGLLNSLGGQSTGSATSSMGGGFDGLLGGLTSRMGSGAGAAAGAGGLGALLGGLASQAKQSGQQSNSADFGTVLNQSIRNNGEPDVQPSQEQEAAAGLLLTAMVAAMKADGQIDEGERQRLMSKLDDSSDEEKRLLQEAMSTDVDLQELVEATPRGMEPQVYAMSVMAIDLDSQAEAQYLDRLGRGLGLSKGQVNGIHEQLGVPTLYA